MEELISEDSNDNDGDKIVFLDWDDTLFPSTELLNNNIDLYNCNIDNIMINIHDPFDFLNFDFFDDDICTSKENKENREKQKNDESKQMRDDIKECEKKVIKLLELFICKKYRVYINGTLALSTNDKEKAWKRIEKSPFGVTFEVLNRKGYCIREFVTFSDTKNER